MTFAEKRILYTELQEVEEFIEMQIDNYNTMYEDYKRTGENENSDYNLERAKEYKMKVDSLNEILQHLHKM